ncbi:MAG: hypothetical protein AB1782_03655 [Cyanobacteriota bacterium]
MTNLSFAASFYNYNNYDILNRKNNHNNNSNSKPCNSHSGSFVVAEFGKTFNQLEQASSNGSNNYYPEGLLAKLLELFGGNWAKVLACLSQMSAQTELAPANMPVDTSYAFAFAGGNYSFAAASAGGSFAFAFASSLENTSFAFAETSYMDNQCESGTAISSSFVSQAYTDSSSYVPPSSNYSPLPTPVKCDPVAARETATITGDPHFKGGDGGHYDVQGEPGKTYNLLSDKGLQFNGTFDSWGNEGATVVTETSINVKGSEGYESLSFNKDGVAMYNGQELQTGETIDLADGGTATLTDNALVVNTAEGYEITQVAHDGYIDTTIATGEKGVAADGVNPHGLAGQTFDADNIARNGATGKGAQGEGAIDGVVKNYEVKSLTETTAADNGQKTTPAPQVEASSSNGDSADSSAGSDSGGSTT